jgi:hypothetical protein
VNDNPDGNIDEGNEETENICNIFHATMLTFSSTELAQQTITLKFKKINKIMCKGR